MPRSVHERIAIHLGSGGAVPVRFDWQRRRYTVQSVEACWKQIGPWWDGDGERTFFRVVAWVDGALQGIYELCYDHENGRWFLETVVD